MSDPRIHDPRPVDPNYPPAASAPYSDPAADPRIADRPVYADRGRGGLVAAGVIAVLLVVALIAFSTGPSTDPGTTAVIPDAATDSAPAPIAPSAPAVENNTAPAPSEAPAAPSAATSAPAADSAAPAPAPAQ